MDIKDCIEVKKLDLISWLENDLNKDKVFTSSEIFSFQMLIINLFFNIDITLARKARYIQ